MTQVTEEATGCEVSTGSHRQNKEAVGLSKPKTWWKKKKSKYQVLTQEWSKLDQPPTEPSKHGC